jgi:hypothetical protein
MKKSVANTAADPTIQFAELEIDGVKYKLAYSFNAIAEAEAVAGCNLLEGLRHMAVDVSAAQLRGMLYAAMTVAQPKVTLEQAGKLIRLDTLPAITLALGEAYYLSFPEQKKIEWEQAAAAEPQS